MNKQVDISSLPYPIASSVQLALVNDLPVIQLKRIGHAANKTVRFLCWLSLALSLHHKEYINRNVIAILNKEKHLNSDWIRLLENCKNQFSTKKIITLAYKLVHLRNYEAHTEIDPLEIPENKVNIALEVFYEFLSYVIEVLNEGELVDLNHEKICLTGPSASTFRRIALLNQKYDSSGIYWIFSNGENIPLAPFIIGINKDHIEEYYILEYIQKKEIGYLFLDGDKVVKLPFNPIYSHLIVSKEEQVEKEEWSNIISRYTNETMAQFTFLPYYIERREPSLQMEEFMRNEDQLCFIFGESGSGVSNFLFNVANQYKDSYQILFVSSVSRLSQALDELDIRKNGYESFENMFVIIDKVEREEDIISLLRFFEVAGKPPCKFIIGGRKHIRRYLERHQHIWETRFQQVEITVFNDDEVKMFFQKYQEWINNSTPLKMLYVFLQYANVSMRTPIFLRIFCETFTSSKVEMNWINTNQLYKLFEKKYFSTHSSLESIHYLCKKIWNKQINQISFEEAKQCENDITFLLNIGMLEANSEGYRFTSEDYLNYKIATIIYAESGLINDWKIFENKKASIPHYIAVMSEKIDISMLSLLLQQLEKEHFFKVLDTLLPYSKVFRALLMLDQDFIQLALLFGKSLREQGLLSPAVRCFSIIQQIPRLPSFLTDQLNAEILITKFQMDGTVLQVRINEKEKCPEYFIYKGYIDYVQDLYRPAQQSFEMAISLLPEAHPNLVSAKLQYAEVLADRGGLVQAEILLADLVEENIDKHNLPVVYNLLGIIKAEQGKLSDALSDLQMGMRLFSENRNYNGMSKSFGDIGYTLFGLGDWQKGIEYLEENRYRSLLSEEMNGLTASSQLLGDIYFAMGEFDQAYLNFEQCIKYATITGNKWRLIAGKAGLQTVIAFRNPNEQSNWNEVDTLLKGVYIANLRSYVYQKKALVVGLYDQDQAINLARRGSKLAKMINAGLYEATCTALIRVFGGEDDIRICETMTRRLVESYSNLYNQISKNIEVIQINNTHTYEYGQIENWIELITDEMDKEDILSWKQRVDKGRMTEEKFNERVSKLLR